MPDFNFEAQFLDSVGLEGESIFLSRDNVQDSVVRALSAVFPNRRIINITRDASAEIMVEMIRAGNGYLNFSTHTEAVKMLQGMGRNPQTIGYEYFTQPLSIPDMEKMIFPAMFTLVGMGDSVSERAATHIHVGFAQNLRLMKRLLRVCLAIDPVLFRLGGMGGIHRGWKNNCAYARPLMNSVAVRMGRDSTPRPGQTIMRLNPTTGNAERHTVTEDEYEEARGDTTSFPYMKIINPMRALEAKTLEEFWASFGVSQSNVTKYHPTRYTAVNFYAILAHGTIEFRHPNSSLDPQLVLALIKFIRGMVEVSTVASKEEIQSFPIMLPDEEISLADSMELVTRVVNLCRKHEVENLPTANEMDILMATLEISRFIPVAKTPVISHVQEFSLSSKLAKLGKLEGVMEVLPASHVDIHNINNRESSIFDSFPEAL